MLITSIDDKSSNVKSIILYTFGCLIIPIFKIISLFIKFKFCHLHTKRIGHLTNNFDGALFCRPNNTLILFSHDKKIANKFIFNFFKQQKNVFFLGLFKYIYFSIDQVNPNSSLIINWDSFQPDFAFYLKFKSKIIFPSYSENEVNNILSKYNIKKNFVGLYSRNNLYFDKHQINDPNFDEYKNFNFKDYSLVIKYLNNKNNSIIKFGETFPEESLKLFDEKIFTSLDFDSSGEMDYFLNLHSRYNVFSNSGASGISEILRKKTVYINLIPFSWFKLSTLAPESVILPKKIFNIKKDRFLTFKEIFDLEGEGIHSIHTPVDSYKKKNLSYISNSPKEILDAVIEMEEKLLGHNENEEKTRLNDLFWKSITNNNFERINYLKNDQKLSVSTQFLKNNQNLF
tara:strand:+ start:91 stop:1290 length:1200 start_codon:yes stop_codon:yes gene_type:complete